MDRKGILAIAGLSAALFAGSAGAVTFNFLKANEFSQSGATCLNNNCATLSVLQNGTGVDFLFTGNLASGEFISELSGNRDPYAASTASGVGGTTDALPKTLISSQDAYKADGDGDFDWKWDLAQGANKFDGSETLSWTFANTALNDIINAISVNGPTGKNGFTFAIHVQGLANGCVGAAKPCDSGWIYATPGGGDQPVPEPGTLALLGLGLAGLGLMRKRSRA